MPKSIGVLYTAESFATNVQWVKDERGPVYVLYRLVDGMPDGTRVSYELTKHRHITLTGQIIYRATNIKEL